MIPGDRQRSAGDAAPAGEIPGALLGLPAGDPAQHGFAPEQLARAMSVLEEGLWEGAYPGAVAVVARHGAMVAATAIGHAELRPHPRPMALSTVFDLASVTKVVAGTSAVLLLLDAGLIDLDDPVARFLPAFGSGGKGTITIRQVLTHTSGLPPWLPCYAAARTAEETFAYLCEVELEARPGVQVQYSDLGMALIRAVVSAADEQLPALLERALFGPLGMRDTGYLPGAARRARAAATEEGNSFEREMVARAGMHFSDWRRQMLVGEVNDGNTHHALEGVSSHAGLFSTAPDLARFGQLYLQGGRWEGASLISPAAIAEATRPQTAGLQDAYGLGWRLAERGNGPVAPLARSARTRAIFPAEPARGAWFGGLLAPGTFGHTGFTGTSLTISPRQELVLILLTNRVHPSATRQGIDRVRARWHNAIAASMLE